MKKFLILFITCLFPIASNAAEKAKSKTDFKLAKQITKKLNQDTLNLAQNHLVKTENLEQPELPKTINQEPEAITENKPKSWLKNQSKVPLAENTNNRDAALTSFQQAKPEAPLVENVNNQSKTLIAESAAVKQETKQQKTSYKTEGSSFGVDLLGTRNSFFRKSQFIGQPDEEPELRYIIIEKPTTRGHALGLGLNYSYALNYKDFFISPGVFVEQNSFGTQAWSGFGKSVDEGREVLKDSRVKINNRYGFKADLGYDFKQISPYFSFGYANISYRNSLINLYQKDYSDPYLYKTQSYKNGNDGNFFYGAGAKIAINQILSLKLEYNYQPLNMKVAVPEIGSSVVGKKYGIKLKSRIDIAKIGLVYNF